MTAVLAAYDSIDENLMLWRSAADF